MGFRVRYLALIVLVIALPSASTSAVAQCPPPAPAFDYRSDLWTQHISTQLANIDTSKSHPRLMLTRDVRARILADERAAVRFLRSDLQPKADYYARTITPDQLESWKSNPSKLMEMFSVGTQLAMAASLYEDPRHVAATHLILDFISANRDYFGKQTFLSGAPDIQAIDWAMRINSTALMYDWMFSSLSYPRREALFGLIASELVNFAKTAFVLPESSRPWWFSGFYLYNWTMVIAGGVTNASLAILGDLSLFTPAIAQQTNIATRDALRSTLLSYIASSGGSVAKALSTYNESGASPEGLMYWEIATTALLMTIDSLQTALGTDFGLSRAPGLRESGIFYLSAQNYRFGDTKGRDGTNIIAFLGRHLNNRCYHEDKTPLKQYAEVYNYKASQQALGLVKGFYYPYIRPCETSACPANFRCIPTFFGKSCVNAVANNQTPYPDWEQQTFKGFSTNFLNLLWLDPPTTLPSSDPWYRHIERVRLFKGSTKTWGPRESLVELAHLESDPYPMRAILKGGTNYPPHAHKDLGALWLHAGNTTWSQDLGLMPNDYALDGFFNQSVGESVSRWSYLRTDSLSHSAPEILPPTFASINNAGLNGFYSQRIQQIVRTSTSEPFASITIDTSNSTATVNLSQIYGVPDGMSRQVRLLNGASTDPSRPPTIEVTDEVSGLDPSHTLAFRMIQCGQFTDTIDTPGKKMSIKEERLQDVLDVRVTSPAKVVFETFPLDPLYRLPNLQYPNLNPLILQSAQACASCQTSPCPTRCEEIPKGCRVLRIRTTENSALDPTTGKLRLSLTLSPRISIAAPNFPGPQAPKASQMDIGLQAKRSRLISWRPSSREGYGSLLAVSRRLARKIKRVVLVSPDRIGALATMRLIKRDTRRSMYRLRAKPSTIPPGSFLVFILRNGTTIHIPLTEPTRRLRW